MMIWAFVINYDNYDEENNRFFYGAINPRHHAQVLLL
jgi:hypothetical protein